MFKPGAITLCMGSIPSGFTSGTHIAPVPDSMNFQGISFHSPKHRTLDSAHGILGNMGRKHCRAGSVVLWFSYMVLSAEDALPCYSKRRYFSHLTIIKHPLKRHLTKPAVGVSWRDSTPLSSLKIFQWSEAIPFPLKWKSAYITCSIASSSGVNL